MTSLVKFIRINLLLLLLFSAMVLVPVKIYDPSGLPRVKRLQKELDSLNEGNSRIKRENETLRMEILSFHSNPNYVEKVARDELGMVGRDEVIYQFPSNND